jgi:aspartate/methionine/tyrosine aminotransferase
VRRVCHGLISSRGMPRHPTVSAHAGAMPASIFARLMERLAGFRGEVVPFHLGDTYVDPPVAARLENIAWEQAPPQRWYAYGQPAGDPELVDAILGKLATRNHIHASAAGVQITAGATQAFSCLAQALFDRGDEVLLLTPCWPLFRGHCLSVGAVPIEVPFSQHAYADPAADLRARIAPFITPRTVAIYFISPSNPDGFVCSRAHLEAIAELAIRHDLWVLADEVYEDYLYDGRVHTSIASLPGMAERTLSVYSFSKSYALAGLRVGYVTGPEPVLAAVRRLANHGVFNVPRALQRAALNALATGDEWIARTRATYLAARDLTVARLRVPTAVPHGGGYVFVDLSPHLAPGETSCVPVLERLAAEGILLAPGGAFGAACACSARLCYTAVPPAALDAGLGRMNDVLSRG